MELKHISHFTDNYNEKLFGLMPDGTAIHAYELTNKNGVQLQVINFGATVTRLKIPVNGKMVDVVLGFDNLDAYINSFHLESAPYLGATVGRFAGRIKKAKFSLNGKTIKLNRNHNKHSLHGGFSGFSQAIWKVRKANRYDNPSITLTYLSKDGEENFPGDLQVELTYTLTDNNELMVEYKAVSSEDTIVNLTHHSYFNLDGHDSVVTDQQLYTNAWRVLETTNENIPTGRFLNTSYCPFDFRNTRNCPEKIDSTFILDQQHQLAARLSSDKTNLQMSVFTNQPAVHIYVGGNCFNQISGKEGVNYHPTSGICFETQNFPDAPNHPHFPSAKLKKGDTYHHKTTYQFQLP